MSKFERKRIKVGWEKLCTNKQTNRQTDRHYENNGHLAVNQKIIYNFVVNLADRQTDKPVQKRNLMKARLH